MIIFVNALMSVCIFSVLQSYTEIKLCVVCGKRFLLVALTSSNHVLHSYSEIKLCVVCRKRSLLVALTSSSHSTVLFDCRVFTPLQTKERKEGGKEARKKERQERRKKVRKKERKEERKKERKKTRQTNTRFATTS